MTIPAGYYDQSYPPSVWAPPGPVDPAITSLAPTSGVVGVLVRVNVNGTDLETDSVIEIDQAPVSTIYVSPTQLYTDYTPAAAGTVRFTVRNANDEESNGVDFTVAAA